MLPVRGEALDVSSLDVSEFETTEGRSVWCGTYNVNGKKERALNLSHWLKQGWTDRVPDVWVITLQESIDLSATNVIKDAIVDTMSRTACEDWIKELHRAFEYVMASTQSFAHVPVLVAKEYMCGIAILVYVGQKIVPKDVAAARIPTGAVGGRLGNKGACAIRLRIESTDICFIGAHLSAHRSDVEARNADYDAICTKDCFRRDRFSAVTGIMSSWVGTSGVSSSSSESALQALQDKATTTTSPQQVPQSQAPPGSERHNSLPDFARDSLTETFGVLDHDVVIFFGDLNYRIVKSAPDKEVWYLIKADLTKLVGLDQLKTEMSARRVFHHGFIEPPLNFAPTYKYSAGTTMYDHEATPEGERNASGKKVRCPAWCDRVLYRVRPRGPRSEFSETIHCLAYDRADDRLCVSDHRPVFALLELKVRRVDVERRSQACAGLAEGFLIDTSDPNAPPPPPRSISPRPRPQLLMTRSPQQQQTTPSSSNGHLPLDPPLILLRAGTPCTVTLTAPPSSNDNETPFAFARLPSWLRLEPAVGTARPTARIRATANLDNAFLQELHDNDGKLGATVQLFLGSTTAYVVPVCVTASPGWPSMQAPATAAAPPALPVRRTASQGASIATSSAFGSFST